MRKFVLALAAMVASFMMTSCKDTVNGFLYNVNVEGNATGDVVVTFPNGSLELDGQAGILFAYSNDSTLVKKTPEDGLLLGAAVQSDDVKTQKFAAAVNNGFSVAFKDAETKGTYHIRVKGYAKEPNTGVVLYIDKQFDYPLVDAE